MATTKRTVDPEFKSVLRQQEINVLRFQPSFERFLAREPHPPAYRFDFNKVDEDIPVSVTLNGLVERGGVIARQRESVELRFFTAAFDIPWVEEWIKNQHSGLPTPIQPLSNNESARIINAIRRKMDDSAWKGDGFRTQDWDGAVDIPTAAATSTMSGDLSDADGPKNFHKAIVQVRKVMENDLSAGRVVMAMDSAEAMELSRPYDDTAPGGPSAIDLILNAVDEIIPVQNTNLNGLAVLHVQGNDNAAWVPTTPGGVEFVMGDAGQGDDIRMKVFHQAGFVYFRDGEGTATADGGSGGSRSFGKVDGLTS